MEWKLEEFQFDLDEDLIAKYPARNREDSRLLSLDREKGEMKIEDKFSAIQDYLREGDILVFNNTKVSKRRLYLLTKNGRIHESILLEEREGSWYTLIRNSSKLRNGDILYDTSGKIEFHFLRRRDGRIYLKPSKVLTEEIFESIGSIPIPPYLKRKADLSDEERYQTVYAKVPGSVAAPTAGLHFTDSLKNTLLQKGIKILEITLSVGYGTFAPLQESQIQEKKLHKEEYHISEECAEILNKFKGKSRIISVGTTTLRALESSFDKVEKRYISGSHSTDIFLYPGDNIESIDGLITNFHLPGSSILLLVAAFASKELVMKAYNLAIQNKMRFYSYGDSMLII
jgi:S-adenosylmethionine:tRNA ribosyltransferase-isomerase